MSGSPLIRFVGESGAVHLCREYVKGYADASTRAGANAIPLMGYFCETCGVEAARHTRTTLRCSETISREESQGT
jgi:hypothetical protein